MAFERQSNADYHARRESLASKLDDGVLLLFAATEAEGQNALHGFRQDDDFYYMTGLREPGAALVVSGKPYREILFLPAHNKSQEKWTGPKLGAESPNAPAATGVARVETLDKLRDLLVEILPSPMAAVATGDRNSIPMSWLRRANAFPNYTTFGDAHSMIAALRVVKDAGEISLIRKATDASVEAHRVAMRNAKPGMNENELAAMMQYEFQRRGCEQPAYSPIVGSGFNSTVLHYSEDENVMKSGDLVVLDVGGEYSMYATDITRTLPVSGHFTPRQREIYDIVLGAQQAAVDAFKSGLSTLNRNAPNSLHKIAAEYINTHGKDRNGNPLGPYFIHGLSHYVGLNVHDPGDTQSPLKPGSVFTIEPGIYIPEESLGVRIEDTYLVKEDGSLDCLSCGAPKKADEVEKAMAAKR
jgi:Xaa-Pro aminopeptidase